MSKNIAVSVRQRLMNLNRLPGQQQDFQNLLRLYTLERLLYRLSQSHYKNDYILKGALLFAAWVGQPHRATKDLDLLGYGNNTIQYLEQVFREIGSLPVQDDGLVFESALIKGTKIHVGQEYEGVQLQVMATLDEIFIASALVHVELNADFASVLFGALELEKAEIDEY